MDHSQNYPSEFSTAARDGEDASQESTLADVRSVVEQLEADHRSKGTKLSGRIIHVTHYLPIITTLNPHYAGGKDLKPISSPKTPVKDIVSVETERAYKPGNCRLDCHRYPRHYPTF
jgi:trehalose 6-phosphate synthase/phosphatase